MTIRSAEIETPDNPWNAAALAEAVQVLEKLRAALEKADTARLAADTALDAMGRTPLIDTRDYLAECLAEAVGEAKEIEDAIARYEEDVA